MTRTWQRGPFPAHLEWDELQSRITHSEWWAKHWDELGCEVTEIDEDPKPLDAT